MPGVEPEFRANWTKLVLKWVRQRPERDLVLSTIGPDAIDRVHRAGVFEWLPATVHMHVTDAIREAQMHNDVRWRDNFKTAETVGVEAVDGKDCYKVVVTPKEGSPQTRYYDKQSNLLVKVTRTVKSPMGELTAETMLTDYRKEGDIMMPHKMTSKVAGQEIKMTVDSVQYNVEIPKDRFDLPEEIKALVQKEK